MGSTLSQTQPQKNNGSNQQFLSFSDIWTDVDKQNNKISHLQTQQNMLQSSRTRSQSLYSNSTNFVTINKNAKKLPHQRNMKPGLSCTISQNKISKNKQKQNKQPCVNTIKNNKYMMRRLILTPDNQNLINKYLSHCGIDQGKIYVQSKSNNINSINKEKVICKLIGFQRQYQRYYCGSHTAVKMVFQHVGSYTLQQQLQIRAYQLVAKTQRLFHQQTTSILMDYSFKLSQITKITKFLLDVAEQILPKESRILHPNLIPKISLADIILQNCETQTVPKLKYRHPIQSIFFYNRQLTRKYIKQQQQQSFLINEMDYSEMQSNILVDIGVCLISICLLQNCYQSCFNSVGQVCISAIEKKIEEISELYQKNFETKLVKLMCDMLHEFIFQGIDQLPRLTFLQAKSKLTKISIKHQQQIIKSISPKPNQYSNVQSTSSEVCTILNETFKYKIKKSHLYIQNLKIQAGANFSKKQRHSQPKNICLESFRKNRNSNNISINLNIRQKNGPKDIISSAKAPKSHPIEWVIDHSSQRKILEVNNSLIPRTKQWLIAEQKQRKNLKNYDYESQYEKIDQKWSEDEDLFKNMPDFWNTQKNCIEKQNEFDGMCVSTINFTYK